MNTTAIQSALKMQPIFQSNGAAIVSVARKCKFESFPKGAKIISQGGKDTDLIFILKGSVEILVKNRNHIVRKAGTHIGEMAAIDPTAKRSATVRTIESTDIARISEEDFSKIAARWPNLWRQLALELANRVRDHTQKITAKNRRIWVRSVGEAVRNESGEIIAIQGAFQDVTKYKNLQIFNQ